MHFPELFYGYFYIPCWTVLEILNLQNLKLVVLTHICKAKSPSQRDFTKYIGRLISKFILQKLPQVILMSANDASSRLCRPALNATQKRCCCSVWGGVFVVLALFKCSTQQLESITFIQSKQKTIKFSSKLSKLYYIQVHFKLLKCNSETQLSCFTNPHLLFSLEFLGIL